MIITCKENITRECVVTSRCNLLSKIQDETYFLRQLVEHTNRHPHKKKNILSSSGSSSDKLDSIFLFPILMFITVH